MPQMMPMSWINLFIFSLLSIFFIYINLGYLEVNNFWPEIDLNPEDPPMEVWFF